MIAQYAPAYSAGAPLGTFFDSAASHVQATLGSAPHGSTVEAFGQAALGAHLTDAAGTVRGLCPGLGEVDFVAVVAALPAEAPKMLHCAPGTYRRELVEGMAALRQLGD